MSAGRRRRVAVLFGGRSAEHEVSIISARSIVWALDPDRNEVVLIGIDKRGGWHQLEALPAEADEKGERGGLAAVGGETGVAVTLSRSPGDRVLVGDDGYRREIDIVFPVLHGPYGEDGTIQGMLELAGVPYVGAGVLASAVGMDKAVQKVLFEAAGLPVVSHEVVRDREWEEDRQGVEARCAGLGVPLFVKPASLGSSVGISKVKLLDDLAPAVEEALSHGTKALVEASIEGAREIECAVLGNADPVASLPGEIVPVHEWYDYRSKYLDDATRLDVPAKLPPYLVKEVQRMAVLAFRSIECEGMARVDFFLQETDDLVVNEINTIPGFTSVSMYPLLWEASGLAYRELIESLIELAEERHEAKGKRGRLA